MHADKVWPDYTGQGVLLADLDDGFQISHPDLVANYRTDLDYDFLGNDADASTEGMNNHGTAVLGLMVADDNHVGTVGVAFDAQAFGIRQGYGAQGDISQTLHGFQYALSHGAAVLNNSWGYTDPFADDMGKNLFGIDYADVGAAMKNFADQGRDGLGSITVFSAGNSRATGDNVNYHNFQNSPYSITVAAINSAGTITSFSTPGAAILVSAGGESVLTTDRTGNSGYVAGDYAYFSGTSG